MATQAAVTILSLAQRHRMLDRFPAENAGQSNFFLLPAHHLSLAQPVPELRQQRVVCDSGQVVNIHLVCKALASGGAYGDENRSPLFALQRPGAYRELGLELITGIDHRVRRLAQKAWPVVRSGKFFNAADITQRIYPGNPLAHGLHLGLTQRVAYRMDLAIDVGFRDMVKVNKRQSANAASGKRFCRPGTDTANAHHCHVRITYLLGACAAIKAVDTTKTPCQIRQRFGGQ
jgi:hypothetical protein